jgi:ATP-dependent Lhr-like helicase
VFAKAFAYLATKLLEVNVRILVDDSSFALIIPIYKDLDLEELVNMLDSNNVRDIVSKAVMNSQLIWRIFRHVANRSFMILSYYKGKKTSLRRQQVNSEIIFSVVRNIADFPLIEEAIREIIEDKMDVIRAEYVLRDIGSGSRRWIILREYDMPSPFAHGILLRGMQDAVLMEDRVKILQYLYDQIRRRFEGVKI